MARILFVEDEEAVLKRLLKYFEREGFEVRGAQTGTEALEAAASFHPDVAVLDVMLPRRPRRNGSDGRLRDLSCAPRRWF